MISSLKLMPPIFLVKKINPIFLPKMGIFGLWEVS